MTRVEALELIQDYFEVRDDFDSLSDDTIFLMASDILVRWEDKFEMVI